VPIEKCQELVPDQIVQSARKMLKTRDDAVAQAMRNLHMSLDKSHEKGRRLAQEVLGAQDGQCLAEEGEQQALETEKLAKYEVDELTHRLEECDQTIEELNADIASTTQEMENYRAQTDKAKLELDSMRFQSSGHGRRATLLRSNDEVTVGGVLQSLKERTVSATRNPALQEKYDATLDFGGED
jgi:chromosome segregation ATPase